MAVVDFSNAVLDVAGLNSSHNRPLAEDFYLRFGSPSGDAYFTNRDDQRVVSNPSSQIILNTPQKVSILFTGTFTTSGTEMYRYYTMWKISNISFSAGDTYSFVVDIEVSGNT